ncbi:DUF4276 family protein [Dehalococcoides mccartyi]|uniref:DUF4276 family protein n=1 Tax=Dehalococcoides mccartyi TaxID=61435 RepID=UPI00075012A1|nr:DUF4276 family protein [Dehalococcoides mccartyi]
MNRVLVLVEGPTERVIIQQVFAPDLGVKNVFLNPKVVGQPGHKGGNRFAAVRRELRNLICQEPESIVTMFFDYYGLGNDWPERETTRGKSIEIARGTLEKALADTIRLDMGDGFNPERFIPYIQFHEMEALLFADPEEMAKVFQKPGLKTAFEQDVKDCGGCENINNNYETAPSRRIQKHFPGYKKGSSVNAHAWRIAQHIGVEKIRQQCPNFNDWYAKLERLGE